MFAVQAGSKIVAGGLDFVTILQVFETGSTPGNPLRNLSLIEVYIIVGPNKK